MAERFHQTVLSLACRKGHEGHWQAAREAHVMLGHRKAVLEFCPRVLVPEWWAHSKLS